MIKRIIGVTFTLLVMVVILFAALEWGNYRSLIFNFGSAPVEEVKPEQPEVEHRVVEQTDSLKVKKTKKVKKKSSKKKTTQTKATQTTKKSFAKRSATQQGE